MQVSVHHSIPGRIRLHYDINKYSSQQAILATSLIAVQDGILDVDVNPHIGSFLICYDTDVISKSNVLALFKALSSEYLEDENLLEQVKDIPVEESVFGVIISTLIKHYLKEWILPLPIKNILLGLKILPRILKATERISYGEPFTSEVLDAAALIVSLATKNRSTASNISMLLGMGDDIEELTKRKSYNNLAGQLLLLNDSVQKIEGNEEHSVSLNSVKPGDTVVFRAGEQILVDGIVQKGEGAVNQASITGESLPVEKKSEDSVFAGTMLEEGELYVLVRSVGTETKVNNIIRMIDNSQNLKALAQKRSEEFANKIVPFNFLLTGLTWLFTRNVTKTVSTLMVDYSCAMKLSAPISVLSAMQEAAQYGVSIKGGIYLERLAESDTIIFDKTGTLTYASPKVSKVYAFNGMTEQNVLKLGACLEEHFPHPLGRAVVKAAEAQQMEHPEYHTKVEYIVAHGIASTINGKKTCIGSAHFIFDDEKIPFIEEATAVQEAEKNNGNSLLYLSYDNQLTGIIAIEDPVREDAAKVIQDLRKTGIKNCLMITGDTEGAAKKIATELGLDAFYAQALPEDKVKFVKKQHKKGRKVIMLGDGINDAPALSAADVGISVDGASSIAGDTADINLSQDGLNSLLVTRVLGQKLMQKMHKNDVFIISFNSALLLLGILGIVPPTLAAILHNSCTIGISINSMKEVL